jgi:hypothetical protein
MHSPTELVCSSKGINDSITDWTIGFQFLKRAKISLLASALRLTLGPSQTRVIQMGSVSYFSGSKAAGARI